MNNLEELKNITCQLRDDCPNCGEYRTNSKVKFFIKLLRISRKYKIINASIRR